MHILHNFGNAAAKDFYMGPADMRRSMKMGKKEFARMLRFHAARTGVTEEENDRQPYPATHLMRDTSEAACLQISEDMRTHGAAVVVKMDSGRGGGDLVEMCATVTCLVRGVVRMIRTVAGDEARIVSDVAAAAAALTKLVTFLLLDALSQCAHRSCY